MQACHSTEAAMSISILATRRMKRQGCSGMQRPFGWMTLQILLQKLLIEMEKLEKKLKDKIGKLTLKRTCGRESAKRWQQ